MASRVEHDANAFLRLMRSEGGSQVVCKSDARVELLDGDVEVNHHLLLARRSRPKRGDVVSFVLEREAGAAGRWLQHHPPVLGCCARPGGLVYRHRPSQQPLVERSEPARIGTVENCRGDMCSWIRHDCILPGARAVRQRLTSR